jgi:hypothetical protein
VESENKGGGIVLYWDKSLVVDVKSYSQRHIDVLIKKIIQWMLCERPLFMGSQEVKIATVCGIN